MIQALVQHGCQSPVIRTHIYTVGSCKDGQASWAFTVLHEHYNKQFSLAGSFGGRVTVDIVDVTYHGACDETNYSAEVEAILMALAWICQRATHVETVIHVDCVAAMLVSS